MTTKKQFDENAKELGPLYDDVPESSEKKAMAPTAEIAPCLVRS